MLLICIELTQESLEVKGGNVWANVVSIITNPEPFETEPSSAFPVLTQNSGPFWFLSELSNRHTGIRMGTPMGTTYAQ